MSLETLESWTGLTFGLLDAQATVSSAVITMNRMRKVIVYFILKKVQALLYQFT